MYMYIYIYIYIYIHIIVLVEIEQLYFECRILFCIPFPAPLCLALMSAMQSLSGLASLDPSCHVACEMSEFSIWNYKLSYVGCIHILIS